MSDRGIRRIITAGLLLAITLLLVFTRIGMIPVPTPAANATIAHIPAIIAGVLEGPLVGLIVGLGFGFASFANATIPMFKDPLVAIVPRLFIGVTASWAYFGLRSVSKRTLYVLDAVLLALLVLFGWQISGTKPIVGIIWTVASVVAIVLIGWWVKRADTPIVRLGIAAAVGSLTNTILVLTVAVLRGYIPVAAAWGIGVTHGIPEVIVAAIITIGVVSALRGIGRGAKTRI